MTVKLSNPSIYSRLTGWGAAGVVFALVWGLLASPAGAGPWLQPRGGYYAKFGASYLYTTQEFSASGDRVPLLTANPLVQDAAYRDVALSSYVEYGIHERVTLVASLPFKILTSRRTELSDDANVLRKVDVTNAGWSDLMLTARLPVVRGRWPVAAEVGAKLPLGYERIPDNGGPALGSGYADGELAVAAGASNAWGWSVARVAYHWLGGPLDDEAGGSFELGAKYRDAFVQVLAESWQSLGDILPVEISSTVLQPNRAYTRVVGTVGVSISPRVGFSGEVAHTLGGKNTAAGTSFAIAIVLTR